MPYTHGRLSVGEVVGLMEGFKEKGSGLKGEIGETNAVVLQPCYVLACLLTFGYWLVHKLFVKCGFANK